MLVLRLQQYTSLTPGALTAVGDPVTDSEAGDVSTVTVCVAPITSYPTIDVGLLRVGVLRGGVPAYTAPCPYAVYRDITSSADYAAPPGVQVLPVRWTLRSGDSVAVEGASASGALVYVVLDVEPAAAALAQRLPPLPGDAMTPPAAWAMARTTSRRRWPALRRLLLGAALPLLLLLLLLPVAGCATSRTTVICQVSDVGPKGSVTLQCAPSIDGKARSQGEFELQLPDAVFRQSDAGGGETEGIRSPIDAPAGGGVYLGIPPP